jgi:hypothetical protein
MVGWNWMPCLAADCALRITLFSFVFHRPDKILPLLPWYSNPRRAPVATLATPLVLPVIAVSLAAFSVAAALAAGLFHCGLDDWPPHLSARIGPQIPHAYGSSTARTAAGLAR